MTWTAAQTKKRRRLIAERDGMLCWLCRLPLGDLDPSRTTIDHLVPRSAGGTNHIDNLRLAHKRCNNTRGSVPAIDSQAAVISALQGLAGSANSDGVEPVEKLGSGSV